MQDLFSLSEHQSSKEVTELLPENIVFQEYKTHKLRTGKLEDGTEVWVVSDIIAAITQSKNPRHYWNVVKGRMAKEGNQSVTNCYQLKIQASDGKFYAVDVMPREQIFRMLQSIPSKKAEPFKLWLAKLANERLEEIENPALGVERARAEYLRKGYSEEWVKQRIDGILHFKQMTDELKEAGAKEDEYGKLINTQHVHAFGVTVQQHKDMKGLSKTQSLRNASSQWENMVQDTADSVSRELLRQNKPSDFNGRNNCMARGGNFGARVKAMLEEELGRPVLSSENYGAIGAKENPLL